MKKLIALLLALVCVLGLVGCNSDNPGSNEVMENFVGKIENIDNENETCLVEVTDSSCSKLNTGDKVIVHLQYVEDVQFAIGDNVKVEFNGVVQELAEDPTASKSISVAFSVGKIENSIE